MISVRRLHRSHWPVALILGVSWLLCLAIAVTEPVHRDEHMFQAAADAVGEVRLYEDVAFFQPPYAAWMYAGWRALAPGDHVLLTARLLKSLLAAGFVLALYQLLRRLGADNLLAAVLVLLLVHTAPVRATVGLARNLDPALLAILGALLLLPLRPGDDEGRWRLLAAGALAGIAVGFRLGFVAPALVVLAWPLIAPTTLSGGRREARWLLAGGALGLAPLAVVLARTDPAALRFNLLDFHLLDARLSAAGEPAGRLEALRQCCQQVDIAGLGVLMLAALVLVVLRGRDWSRTVWLLALWLLPAGAAMVLLPGAAQPEHAVLLLLAVTMLLAVAALRLEGHYRLLLVALTGLVCLVNLVHHGSDDMRRLGGLGQVEIWPAVRLHDAGRTVADLTAGRPDLPVASTHPLYVLESGRPLAREFTTGEYAWRLGDLLDSATQEQLHLVTPETFAAFMDRQPVSALIVQAVAPWDAPLTLWARNAAWRPAPVAGGTLAWLPPRSTHPAEQ